MATLILDPEFLQPPIGQPPAEWISFWLTLVAWEADSRVRIGAASLGCAAELMREVEDDKLDHPPHSRSERRRVAGRLLSRVLKTDGSREIHSIDPGYLGSPLSWQRLSRDLGDCVGEPGELYGVATAERFWTVSAAAASCDPPPPASVALCCSPGEAIAGQPLEMVRDLLFGRRLRIVGGQVEKRVVDAIVENLGIEENAIRWEASERKKKPKLEGWKDMESGVDVAVCITGLIGHSSSDRASTLARKADVDWVEARSPGQIVKAIEQYFVAKLLVGCTDLSED